MLPLRDHNPSERTPYVTWALIAVNIAVFLSYWPELGDQPRLLINFYNDYALVPAEVTQGFELQTLLTSAFLHGGWLHLAGNMLFLYIFGDNLEDQLGHVGYLIFYLLCGVAAGLAQVYSSPYSYVPMVGASGAIAGVMGGYLLLFPRARVDLLLILFVFFKVITIPAWLVLGLWFGLQLVSGAAADAVAGGGVAHWAHAGGFVAGLILILPIWIKRGGPQFWQKNHGVPPYEDRRSRRQRDPHDIPIRSMRSEEDTFGVSNIPQTGSRRNGGADKSPDGSPWGGRR